MQRVQQTHCIFISYRRGDNPDLAKRIYDKLADRFGTQAVFIDYEGIPPAAKWQDTLLNALARCDLVVVVIGPQWQQMLTERMTSGADDWVRTEIENAVANEKLFAPVLIREAALPAADDLPEAMRPMLAHQASEVGEDARFHPDTDRLIAGIEEALKTLPDPSKRFEGYSGAPSALVLQHPDNVRLLYSQHLHFVGRTTEIAQINAQLSNGHDTRQMLLQAVGGQGKTTLATKIAEGMLRAQPAQPVLWLSAGNNEGPALFDALAKPYGMVQAVNSQPDPRYRALVLQNVLRASGASLLEIGRASCRERGVPGV